MENDLANREGENRVRAKTVAWLASELHDFERLDDLRDKMSARLADWLPEAEFEPAEKCEPESSPVLMILTGGTERPALEWLDKCPGRVTLLAHPAHNSMAACLEILARLRQAGRRGRVMLFDDSEHNKEALRARWEMRRVHMGMQGARVGLVGQPSDWLVASVPDVEQVKRRWGVDLVPLGLDALAEAEREIDSADLKAETARWLSDAGRLVEPDEAALSLAVKTALALERLAKENDLHALGLGCFDWLKAHGVTGCLALSRLNDLGLPAACEADPAAAVTMLWSWRVCHEPAFMANPQWPQADSGVLELAHCTAPSSMARSFNLRSHFESGRGVAVEADFAPGAVSLVRLGGQDLDQLYVAEGWVIDGAGNRPDRCRTQVAVRMEGDALDQLLSRPLGNHLLLIKGRHAERLDASFSWFA